MNQTSPVTTGAAAVSGAMIGGVIAWLCGSLKIAVPPADVAGTMGALVLMALHALGNWLATRPQRMAAPAPVVQAPVQAAPAPVAPPPAPPVQQ